MPTNTEQTIRQRIIDDVNVQNVIVKLIGSETTKSLPDTIHEKYEAA